MSAGRGGRREVDCQNGGAGGYNVSAQAEGRRWKVNGIDHPLQTGQGDLYLYPIGTRWKLNGIVHPFQTGECVLYPIVMRWKLNGIDHPFQTGECVLYPIVMRWKVNGTDHPFWTGMCDLYSIGTEGARTPTPGGKPRAWRESAGVQTGQSSDLRGHLLLRSPNLGQEYVCISRGHHPLEHWRRTHPVRLSSFETALVPPRRQTHLQLLMRA